ncbi:hypothetical protein BDZ94DRAFT_1231550 [Collybia nuda]|uniref:Uncharacterized protein n=1 Tax=Collybia nuda TaxID=64659 RepID=A0A9P5YJD2_9AGAR|nr:hypothetical protein BDZ94DRAFT_1231550 [Collybia nuda]
MASPSNPIIQSSGALEPNAFQTLISPEIWTTRHLYTNTQCELKHNVLSPLLFSHNTLPNCGQSFVQSDFKTQIAPLLHSDQLSLHFCGEDIVYDLRSLERDPRFLIELLKMTSSGHGSWIIVAIYYRRAGNSEAAVSIMESMIEAMRVYGATDGQLKPAYLLLSGCENDLAKRARSYGERNHEAEHQKHSNMWLRKVYGDHNVINAFPVTRRSEIGQCPPPKSLSRSKISTFQNNPTPTAFNKSLLETLGLEVRSLRSQSKRQSDLLLDIRFEKRKLEEDLLTERQFRRKIQRHLDEADKELHIARRTETYALEQVKNEIDARRRAEESARTEKSLRLDLTKTLKRT